MKRRIYVLIGVVLIIFALDFVPVKFAVSESTQANDDNTIEYIFTYEPKTSGADVINWAAEAPPAQFRPSATVVGSDPYDVLANKDFDAIKLYNAPSSVFSINRFIFRGKAEVATDDSNGYDLTIHSEEWKILYPINRLSVRRYYVPKSYLTIFDYNWGKVIAMWFSQ